MSNFSSSRGLFEKHFDGSSLKAGYEVVDSLRQVIVEVWLVAARGHCGYLFLEIGLDVSENRGFDAGEAKVQLPIADFRDGQIDCLSVAPL